MRVTTTLRVAGTPEGPVAVMVMVLKPTRSGTLTLHWAVPIAVPDWPKLFDQITDATLPVVVPENVIDALLVDTEVPAGEAMVRTGALPPEDGPEEGPGDDVDGAWRVTVTDWETCVELSVAVTVMVLRPVISGMEEMVQSAAPDAVPQAPLADQVSVIVPLPPDVIPLRLMAVAVVTEAVDPMVRVSGAEGAGAGVGVGVGAGAGVGLGAGVGAGAGASAVCAA